MGDETPKQIIKEYKRALAHAKGKRYSNETGVNYENGWYHVLNVDGTETSCRKRQLLYFAERLLEQELDSAAYDEALSRRRTKPVVQHPAFDAEAYNRDVAERIAAHEQAKIAAQPKPPQVSFAGLLLSLLVIAASIGFIRWGYLDNQEQKQKVETEKQRVEAEREAKARTERQKWNPNYEVEHARSPSSPKLLPAADDPEFKAVLGNVWPGVQLYYRTDHRFYGVITGVEGDKVEVALAQTVSIDSRGAHGYAAWLDRSYVTKNFVMKRK